MEQIIAEAIANKKLNGDAPSNLRKPFQNANSRFPPTPQGGCYTRSFPLATFWNMPGGVYKAMLHYLAPI